MRKIILLAFMLIINIFAGEMQEMMCDDKSLSYCINHFDRQCNAKNYGACFLVGNLHGEQKQYSKAKKYYEMVCDRANSKDSYEVEMIDGRIVEFPAILGIKSSCRVLGIFYHNGYGVRQSYEKTLHYFKKACDLEEGESCFWAGGAYLDGEGVKKDFKKAISFYAKSCKLESGAGCVMLGVFYHDKQNYSKAKELYGKACDLGNQIGCDGYKKLKEKGY